MALRVPKMSEVIKKSVPSIVLKRNSISVFKSVTPLFKEDTLYQSKSGDFFHLKDERDKITLFHRRNLNTRRSETVARYCRSSLVVWERTSEYIASIIGQANYELVFSSLCSVICEEFRVRAILALLSSKKAENKSQSCQSEPKVMVDTEVQTNESCIDFVKKPIKRLKRPKVPYVVTDSDVPEKVSKIIVYPENFNKFNKTMTVKTAAVKEESPVLFLNNEHILNNQQDLSMLDLDENSKDSIGNLSSFSISTTPELMKEPLSLIDRVTEPVHCSTLTMLDGTVLSIPCKIEDDFHVATPEILQAVPPEHRRKLLWYQAYTDWKYCLTRDDNDNLPIHLAVLNDDVHLLKRQCLVLKTRNESVDITNGDNMTALQMSVLAGSASCTSLLLQLGANPLVADEEYRTCFHLAAEAGCQYVEALIKKCQDDPLSILRASDELWKPELALKPKDYQVNYLLNSVCTMYDSQGYTPLMLASKLGAPEAVRALLAAAPAAAHRRAPSSGAGALHLAAAAACTDGEQRGNKSKVSPNFKQTIELLLNAGADPSQETFSGTSVNSLLADSDNAELSMIIACKRTAVNCKNFDSNDKPFVIVKENDGTMMTLKDHQKKTMEIEKIKGQLKRGAMKKEKKLKEKPVILENKVITQPAPQFINTYRNFVHKLKNPDLKGNNFQKLTFTVKEEKPTTSTFDSSKVTIKTSLHKIPTQTSGIMPTIVKIETIDDDTSMKITNETDPLTNDKNTPNAGQRSDKDDKITNVDSRPLNIAKRKISKVSNVTSKDLKGSIPPKKQKTSLKSRGDES